MPRGPLVALALAAFAVALPARRAPPPHAAFLVGVKEIGFPGLPGTVTVFGPRAFPVVTAPGGGEGGRRGRGCG